MEIQQKVILLIEESEPITIIKSRKDGSLSIKQ